MQGRKKKCAISHDINIADFSGNALGFVGRKLKAKLQNLDRVRAEEAGTSAAGALVSNPENKPDVIKTFIDSRRFCLGT